MKMTLIGVSLTQSHACLFRQYLALVQAVPDIQNYHPDISTPMAELQHLKLLEIVNALSRGK